MSPREIDAVILDWSGVISDDRMPAFLANCMISNSLGIEPPPNFEAWQLNTSGNPEAYFLSRGIPVTPEQIKALYNRYFNIAVALGYKPGMYHDVPGALEVLKRKGRTLTVLSSHITDNLRIEAAEYGILGQFDRIQGDVSDKATGLTKLCQNLSFHPSRTVYIGDMVKDKLAADQAGIPCMLLTRGYHPREMLRLHQTDDAIFNSLIEAAQAL